MKTFLQLITILFLAWALELFFPWWSIAIAGFVGGLIFHSRSNFIAGFLAIAILWIIKALMIENSATTELTARIADLLMVKSKPVLFGVMAFLGGLVGGLSSVSGSLLRGSRKKRYY